ncbi:hypothetical protein GOODEAATRI_027854 [Goodea atripinnis]|uniref:Uncharacterized protein n=1 Tax=Goodea atripinnis TaxID=208336 RepID=A0ABV0PHR4_9TELE
MSSFSTTMSKGTSCGRGKDVSLFKKGQIIGMHQAVKTSKKIAETTKTGLSNMFKSESKIISTCTMQRELKVLAMNSFVAVRKPLISKANQKKGYSVLGNIKIGR